MSGALVVNEEGIEPVLAAVLDAALSITEADFGDIQLVDAISGDLKIVAQRGFEPWRPDFWADVGHGQGVCGTALEGGERVIVEDVEQSPIFAGSPALEIQRRPGVRAVQSTPLVSRSGRKLGMFSTHCRTPRRPDPGALRLHDLLARQAADLVDHFEAATALREADRRKDAFVAS